MATKNIARTPDHDADAVAGLWQNSPGHWANILQTTARNIGIGVADGAPDGVTWVMVFGAER